MISITEGVYLCLGTLSVELRMCSNVKYIISKSKGAQ